MKRIYIILSLILSLGVVFAPLNSAFAEEEMEIEMDDVSTEFEEVELLYSESIEHNCSTEYSLWYEFSSSISVDEKEEFVSLNKPIKKNLFLRFNSLVFYE